MIVMVTVLQFLHSQTLSIRYMAGGCSLFKMDMRLKASLRAFACPHAREFFVPILCHELTKTGHILGYVAIVKSFYNIDIVILICCSLSLFTNYVRLLIIESLVRVWLGEPAIAGS